MFLPFHVSDFSKSTSLVITFYVGVRKTNFNVKISETLKSQGISMPANLIDNIHSCLLLSAHARFVLATVLAITDRSSYQLSCIFACPILDGGSLTFPLLAYGDCLGVRPNTSVPARRRGSMSTFSQASSRNSPSG